jgi:hypothetical protein
MFFFYLYRYASDPSTHHPNTEPLQHDRRPDPRRGTLTQGKSGTCNALWWLRLKAACHETVNPTTTGRVTTGRAIETRRARDCWRLEGKDFGEEILFSIPALHSRSVDYQKMALGLKSVFNPWLAGRLAAASYILFLLHAEHDKFPRAQDNQDNEPTQKQRFECWSSVAWCEKSRHNCGSPWFIMCCR